MRKAAMHCAALVPACPPPIELMPRLTAVAQTFAKALAPHLASFTSGEAPRIKVHAARQDDDLMFGAEVGGLAANSLYAIGAHEVPLLVSLQAGAVLGYVDRTFGGRGAAPDPLPSLFPLSAELLIARLEAVVMGCLAEALGMTDAAAIHWLRRNGSLSNLAAYPDGASLAVVKLEVSEGARPPWSIYLCLTEALLPLLFGDGAAAVPPRVRGRADPESAPFAGLPLAMTAVLVDMPIAMAAIAAITPGTVLPVAVARQVPLKIGGKTIATGSIGAADDRVAIRITQAFG